MPVPDLQSLMLPVLEAFADGGEPPLPEVRERITAADGLSAQYVQEILLSGRLPVEELSFLGWRGTDSA